MGQVPQVAEELVPHGEVEPVLLVERRDRRRLRPGPEHRPCLSAWDQVDEDEHEGHHADDDDDGLQEPPDEEAGHGAMLGTQGALRLAHP